MKISFWSHVRGLTGVTTNLACVSAIMAIGRMGKTVVLENHYSTNSIGDLILVPEQIDHLHEHGEYYSKYGIEYILKRLYSGERGISWYIIVRFRCYFLLCSIFRREKS